MTRRGLGYIPETWETTPPEYTGVVGTAGLPERVDQRDWVVRIYDQLLTNSCVGQALSQSIRCKLYHDTGEIPPEPSAQWIWNMARVASGTLGENTGVKPTKALKVLEELGYPTADHYPFRESLTHDKPSAEVARHAYDQKFTHGYTVIPGSGKGAANRLRVCLANGQFPTCGLPVDDVWASHTGAEKLTLPRGKLLGRHMVLLVGYGPGYFVIANSWGTSWGMHGFAFVDTSVMESSECTDKIVPTVVAPPSS